MKCDSHASPLALTFASFCLGYEPKVRVVTRRGRGGEGTIKIQKGGLRSKKLSKSEKGVGGLGTSPTWRGGFEVQKELGRKIKEVN
jgi:hypothetical protein